MARSMHAHLMQDVAAANELPLDEHLQGAA
jgi:hypothetical protein